MNSYDYYYNSGFEDAAVRAGCNPAALAKFAEDYMNAGRRGMRKSAGGYGSLARLITKLSPRIKDPSKLNWFTKLFTTTRTPLSKVRSHAGSLDGAGNIGSYGSGTYTDSVGELARSVTRVSPLKILAGLTAVGGAGTAAGLALTPDKPKTLMDRWNSLDPELRKKILIGLGIGVAGLGAGGIGYALGRSKD